MQDTSPKAPTLYDTDFYAWTHQQAALLRAGRFAEADITNLVEEIETLGRSEKRELVARLTILLVHLLKWRFQPKKRSKSWRLTIEGQRVDLAEHLSENPSLKSQLALVLVSSYRRARIEAAKETGLDKAAFPDACPWSCDQISDDDFRPEE